MKAYYRVTESYLTTDDFGRTIRAERVAKWGTRSEVSAYLDSMGVNRRMLRGSIFTVQGW